MTRSRQQQSTRMLTPLRPPAVTACQREAAAQAPSTDPLYWQGTLLAPLHEGENAELRSKVKIFREIALIGLGRHDKRKHAEICKPKIWSYMQNTININMQKKKMYKYAKPNTRKYAF